MLKMAGLMIAAELAQGCLIQLKQNLAQLLGLRIASRETLSVNLAQRAEEGVPVLMADFAIVIAVAIVETCCFAPLNLCSCGDHLPNQSGWQRLLPFLLPNSPTSGGTGTYQAVRGARPDQTRSNV
jgi:hypothetical protein